ncbi:MAG: response regulator [Magnetococcales bacterium]|nr:response regulator [Magnetococcales bacterium]
MKMKKAMQNPFSRSVPLKDSIAQRLFFVVFFFYIIISVFITSIQIFETYTRTKNDISNELQVFGRAFESGISKALWEFDEDVLKSSVIGLMEIPGILGIKVTSPKNGELLSGGGYIIDAKDNTVYIDPVTNEKRVIKEKGYFNSLFWHEFDVVYYHLDNSKKIIGHTTIYSSINMVIERIKFSVLVIVVSELIEILAMWLIFVLVIRHILGRPLDILTSATQRLAQDDIKNFNVDIKSKGRNELNLLEEAFNSTAKKLHAAKNELENRMHLALTAGRIATWIWYPEKDRLDFDKNLPNIFGQLPGSFGSSFLELNKFLLKDDRELLTKTLQNSVTKFLPFSIDLSVRARNGSTLYVSLQATVQIDEEESSTLRLVGTAMDVTERKNMNIELLKSKDIAEQANHAKSNFLATMSHEIRTPMNAVNGSVELLYRQKLPKNQVKLVDTISYATKNLLNIINDILDLAKIEEKKLTIEFIDFNLSDFSEQLLSTMEPIANKKNLKLLISLDDSLPENINGDQIRLQQILLNLVNNAIKFTEQGHVKITIQKSIANSMEEHLEFLVTDSGIGIPPDKLPLIFDPFTQVDSSTSRSQHGTGLGLAICKRLVELMDGTIEVNSSPGVGSTFKVILPFENSTIKKEHDDKNKQLPPLPLTILLVEDEPVSQFIVQSLLEDEGYKVFVASSGPEALDQIIQNSIDVILMDLRMPKMDGFETTKRIRAFDDKKISNIKIVAFTGDVMKETVQQCLDIGMDGVIAKPVVINEINRVLSSVIVKNS